MKIQDFKNKIPFGGYEEISKRAKVNKSAIIQYISGSKKTSIKKELELIRVILNYLKEIKEEREALQRDFNELEQ